MVSALMLQDQDRTPASEFAHLSMDDLKDEPADRPYPYVSSSGAGAQSQKLGASIRTTRRLSLQPPKMLETGGEERIQKDTLSPSSRRVLEPLDVSTPPRRALVHGSASEADLGAVPQPQGAVYGTRGLITKGYLQMRDQRFFTLRWMAVWCVIDEQSNLQVYENEMLDQPSKTFDLSHYTLNRKKNTLLIELERKDKPEHGIDPDTYTQFKASDLEVKRQWILSLRDCMMARDVLSPTSSAEGSFQGVLSADFMKSIRRTGSYFSSKSDDSDDQKSPQNKKVGWFVRKVRYAGNILGGLNAFKWLGRDHKFERTFGSNDSAQHF